MPLLTNLNSLECRNALRNGLNFSLNSSDVTPNLVANAGEWLQITAQVDVSWFAQALPGNTWVVQAGLIVRSSGSFHDDGFLVGQTFEFYADWSARFTASAEFVGTITGISAQGDRLDFTVSSGTQTTTGGAIDAAGIWAQADLAANCPDAAIFGFNLLPNGDAFTATSRLTTTLQQYYAGGIDLATGGVSTMSPRGIYRGWQAGSATIVRESFVSATNSVRYEIVHSFIATPFFVLNYLPNLQARTVPADWTDDLAYMFRLELRHGLNTTTGEKVFTLSGIDGVTSWFGESVGGFGNAYSVSNAVFTQTTGGASVAGLQRDGRTTLTFDLDSSGTIASGERIGLYVAYLPNREADYQETQTTLQSNFLFDALFVDEGAAAATGTNIIKSLEASLVSGTLEVEAELEYTSAQALEIGAGGRYLIWAQIEDSSLSAPNTDRASLIVDLGEYVVGQFISGLANFTRFQVLTHPFQYGVASGTASTVNAWPEDGVLVDFAFDLDLAKDAVLTGLTFALIARNSVTGEYFELDRYNYNLSGGVVSGGVQQFNINITRGYELRAGDQFNFVRLETGARVGDLQGYTGAFAQKLKWQDWVPNPAADPVFYDANEPNNNLNFNSFNYSDENNYEIFVIGIAETTGTDANGLPGVGRETQLTGEFDMFNYGVSDDGTWTGEIKTETLAGGNLNGQVLRDQDTLFRVVWENASTDLSRVYAIHRIQPTAAPGDNIEEMSSIYLPLSPSMLKPKIGQTRLDLFVSGSDIHSECLIDHTQLPAGPVNLSARIERYTPEPQFTVSYTGCVMRITETYSGSFTDITYEFRVGGVLVDSITTTSSTYDWLLAPGYAGQTVEVTQIIDAGSGTITTQTSTNVPLALQSCITLQWDTTASGEMEWQMRVASGAYVVDWGDGTSTSLTGTGVFQALSHDYAGASGTKTVRVYATSPGVITGLEWTYADALQTGALDISGLDNLTSFSATGDSSLNNFTSITEPTMLRNMERYVINQALFAAVNPQNWVGDVANPQNATSFVIANMPNLTSLNLGNGTINNGLVSVSNLACTFSGTRAAGGSPRIFFNNNTNFYAWSGTCTYISAANNTFSGIADLSGLTCVGYFQALNNSFSEIREPAVTGNRIDVSGNNITAYTPNPSTTGVINDFDFRNQPAISFPSLAGYAFANNAIINFENNVLSQSQNDTAFGELATIAGAGPVAWTVEAGGSNTDPPTGPGTNYQAVVNAGATVTI